MLVTDVYEFEEIIGEGAFSSVVLATHNKTQNKYAIKIIDKSKIITDIQRERVDREIEILKTCNHPNIVKLIETFESDEEISLVMEYMNGGDLFDRIAAKGAFSESETRIAFKYVLAAVDFLHDRSLVHRDLKPENLLYSTKDGDASVKLSDFGLSKFSNERDNEGLQTPCGTLAYTAPEITNSKVYRKSVDIWSCGCILYFMLFGRPPFYSDNEEEIYDLVSEGKWSFPDFVVSEQAKDLVSKLLEKDPLKRLTAKQAIVHPFITQQLDVNMSYSPSSFNSSPYPPISPSLPTSSLSLALAQSPQLPQMQIVPPQQSLLPPQPCVYPQQPQQALNYSFTSVTSSSITPHSPSAPSTPVTIPHLRASMQFAMDALRGPLTPPLVSPLESNIWKKRAKSRALLLNNTPLNITPQPSFDEGISIHKKPESESECYSLSPNPGDIQNPPHRIVT